MDTKGRYLLFGMAGTFLIALLAAAKYPGLVSNPKYLAAIVILEVIAFCLWRYEDRFFPLLILVFLWAGASFPYKDLAGTVRWVVLAAAAAGGFVIWLRDRRFHLGLFHFVAVACILAGIASSSVSANPRISTLKIASLAMLYLYAATGGRAVYWHDPAKFMRRLTTGSQVVVFVTALCYFVFRFPLYGNPNSLGAVMAFTMPLLLWHVLVAPARRYRYVRLAALFLSGVLLYSSAARAAILGAAVATILLCAALRLYWILPRVALASLLLISLAGVLEPDRFPDLVQSVTGNLIYKKNMSAGLLSSRLTPWTQAVATIREHPWVGSGFGTRSSFDVGDPSSFHFTRSNANFEYGNSYLSIIDYTGLVGAVLFGTLIFLIVWRIATISFAVRKNPYLARYAVPLMLLVTVGLVHALFEDWLFAPGSYVCIFFWCCAFLFIDFVPASAPLRTADERQRFTQLTPGLVQTGIPDLRMRPGI